MDTLNELRNVLQGTIGLLAYVLAAFVLPCVLVQRSLEQHYREWIRVHAYWGRSADKWIVGDRVFYRDELLADIRDSIVFGIAGGLLSIAALAWGLPRLRIEELFLPTLIAAPVLRFIYLQLERRRRIDMEILLRQRADPSFDPNKELLTLLSSERNFVTRVIGKHKGAWSALD